MRNIFIGLAIFLFSINAIASATLPEDFKNLVLFGGNVPQTNYYIASSGHQVGQVTFGRTSSMDGMMLFCECGVFDGNQINGGCVIDVKAINPRTNQLVYMGNFFFARGAGVPDGSQIQKIYVSSDAQAAQMRIQAYNGEISVQYH